MHKNQRAEIRKPEILENYYKILIDEGFKGAPIGKIAKHMHIHPSLIIHDFKTKENMSSEVVDLLIKKYLASGVWPTPEIIETLVFTKDLGKDNHIMDEAWTRAKSHFNIERNKS